MKIIDKNKDYYDWVVSIYGIDEKMVYDRRGSKVAKDIFGNPWKTEVPEYFKNGEAAMHANLYIGHVLYCLEREIGEDWKIIEKKRVTDEDIHRGYYDAPILLVIKEWSERFYDWDSTDWGIEDTVVENPLLLSFEPIPSLIPAEEVWCEVYSYISSRFDVSEADKRTDREKIEGHGFDYKTSFRKEKKK